MVFMEKILPTSGRIQKTATSRIALIGMAAATMMITLSIIGAVIQLQQASAAKPQFCFYSARLSVEVCTPEMKTCHELQSLEQDKCHPQQR